MNLTKYLSRRPVMAARIEIVGPVMQGLSQTVRTLTVRDAGDQMVDVTMRQLSDYTPQPGDYLIVDGVRKYVQPKAFFENDHVKVQS